MSDPIATRRPRHSRSRLRARSVRRRLRRCLMPEPLEERVLLTFFPTFFELSSLLPSEGGDGTTGFVINGIDADDRSGSSADSSETEGWRKRFRPNHAGVGRPYHCLAVARSHRTGDSKHRADGTGCLLLCQSPRRRQWRRPSGWCRLERMGRGTVHHRWH